MPNRRNARRSASTSRKSGAKTITHSQSTRHPRSTLVNHDKNQFVDLKKYKEKSTVDGWCIFPISLLTALGNGRGGGDYHKDDPLVGSWAFDTISLTDQPVTGMEEIEPVFTE